MTMPLYKKNDILRRMLYGLIYLIFILLTAVLVITGPRIEVLLYPVVESFEITDISHENGRTFVKGVMIKSRPECSPEELNIFLGYALRDPEAQPEKLVEFDLAPDPYHKYETHLRNRPAGPQYWGPWELFPPEKPVGPIITISVVHRCHFFWQTRQVLFRGPAMEFFPELYEES